MHFAKHMQIFLHIPIRVIVSEVTVSEVRTRSLYDIPHITRCGNSSFTDSQDQVIKQKHTYVCTYVQVPCRCRPLCACKPEKKTHKNEALINLHLFTTNVILKKELPYLLEESILCFPENNTIAISLQSGEINLSRWKTGENVSVFHLPETKQYRVEVCNLLLAVSCLESHMNCNINTQYQAVICIQNSLH